MKQNATTRVYEGNMDRRTWLKQTAAGLASWTACASEGKSPEDTGARPPNILLLLSDEHNAAVMGCMGDACACTPHLDALAARGILFSNAYCNSPLCVPSRLSFISGQYVSRTGAWSNSCWLPSDEYPSLPRLLRDQGYETILCGKMHFDATRRYGFEVETGPLEGWQSNRWAFKTGTGNRREPDNLTPKPGYSSRLKEAAPSEESPVCAFDTQVTQGAAAYLRNRTTGDRPFFLLAGFIAPHFPLLAPERLCRHYEGRIPLPRLPEGHVAGLPLNYQHLRVGFDVEEVPEERIRKGREVYYALVEWLDEQIGLVLDALEASGELDHTLVVYTTDHGENMGEHGLWWKNCLYDPAAKVPLILSWPGRWEGGQRRTGVCSLVDLTQTLAEVAGSAGVPQPDGESLCAYLDNDAAPWKDRAVSEYYGHNIASGMAMLREGRFKYIYHAAPGSGHAGQRELFDVEADPGEFHNLASNPEQAERVETMHRSLERILGEEVDSIETRCRAQIARGYGREEPKKPKELRERP